jgi:acetyltransferase-like isoleucine patch superfamily enzyme
MISDFTFLKSNRVIIDAQGNRYEEEAFIARGVKFGDLTHLSDSYEFIYVAYPVSLERKAWAE